MVPQSKFATTLGAAPALSTASTAYLTISLSGLAHKECNQNDDGNGYTEQQQQNGTHSFLQVRRNGKGN